MASAATPQTLYEKIFQSHIVHDDGKGNILLAIDRHLVHEGECAKCLTQQDLSNLLVPSLSPAVTSPQAFEGLRKAGRKVRRVDLTLATVDHNIPTISRKTYKDTKTFVEESNSRTQCLTLEDNVKEFGLTFFGLTDNRQGIVHVIGPEQVSARQN